MTALFLFGIEKYCERSTPLEAELFPEHDFVDVTLNGKLEHQVPQ